MRCSFWRHCSPTPSVGADSLADASSCRLRTNPLIDAAGTPAHCWCFWHDRCTAPAAGAVGLGTRTRQNKFSQLVLEALSASRRPQRPTTPPASTEIDGTGKALTECHGTSSLLTSFAAKQP
ncbi:hypothetical protein TcG_12010 [Trypanosoma cruzi]|nr:hypothetical protein TcG_12010 [Trypanosoma cruzi]